MTLGGFLNRHRVPIWLMIFWGILSYVMGWKSGRQYQRIEFAIERHEKRVRPDTPGMARTVQESVGLPVSEETPK